MRIERNATNKLTVSGCEAADLERRHTHTHTHTHAA